jgi:hypothetical protein
MKLSDFPAQKARPGGLLSRPTQKRGGVLLNQINEKNASSTLVADPAHMRGRKTLLLGLGSKCTARER